MVALRPAIPGPRPVADEALAREGLRHHAEHRPAAALQSDQRPPHRQAGDEGTRPVDRIEHPDVFGLQPLAAHLLAEDAVVGMMRPDQRPHRRLRRPIGHRDRIEGAAAELVLDDETRPEMRQDRRPGRVREAVEEGGEIGGVGRGGHDRLRSDRGLEARPSHAPSGAARQVRIAPAPPRPFPKTRRKSKMRRKMSLDAYCAAI